MSESGLRECDGAAAAAQAACAAEPACLYFWVVHSEAEARRRPAVSHAPPV
jgi:hypothetical protein